MNSSDTFTITDKTYGIKLYEVAVGPCGLSVLSYIVGRVLTTEEIFEDKYLIEEIQRYLIIGGEYARYSNNEM
jgi:hypothetical protein